VQFSWASGQRTAAPVRRILFSDFGDEPMRVVREIEAGGRSSAARANRA